MRQPRGLRRVAAAFGLYSVASLLLFGPDVIADPSERVVGDDGPDKTLYMWSFEWWPRSILDGRNPLDVDVAWMPHGFDFGLGTAGGGLAMAAAPLTALVGPVVTYNVLILLAPTLSGTTAFLLADRITGRFLPALVGGYVYGFSSYELGHVLGHLPLSFVALVPLVPYLVLRRYDGELARSTFIVLLAAVLVAQFLIVTQILFSLVVVAAVAAVAAAAIVPGPEVRRTVAEAGGALAVAVLAVSPVVLYALFSDAAAPARSPFYESADVVNYVLPTRRTWVRPPGAEQVAERFTATGAEQGAYLGLPLIVLVALAALRRPWSRPRLLLGTVLAVAFVLSLGTRPRVAGEIVGVGPWTVFAHLPVLDSALPARLTLYTALAAALLVALALADRPRSVARWSVAALGVVATLPNLGLGYWSSDVPRARFFETAAHERHLEPGATVLVMPYGPAGWSMLWQAETGFAFRMIGGHFALRVTPSEEPWRDVYESLGTGGVSATRLRAFLDTHAVDAVVVAPGTSGRVRRMVEKAAGVSPTHSADALVYRLIG